MNLIIEPIKKITKWQAKKVPELFTYLDTSCDTMQIFAVYIDDHRIAPHIKTKQGSFVGAMMVNFESFTIRNGKPWFDVYIDKFEVAKGWRGNGIGSAMLHALRWKYDLHKITLCHMLPESDGGTSYRFWRHVGFHKPDGCYQMMEKTITRF